MDIKTIAAAAGLAVAAGGCVRPYNEPEFVDVAPNETAFVIRLEGQNNSADGQAKLLSEAYLEANRVAAKRIEVTHRWLDTGYAHDSGKWIPDVTVVKVDRSAVTRQWTEEGGTSVKNEAVSIESKDSVGFSVGFTCTAYIREEDAAKYLYTHPSGSLASVMDTEVLGRVQRDCQMAVNGYALSEVPAHKGDIQKAVETDVVPWFATRGVTITNVGMYGGLHYENPAIQKAIDEAAAASNLKTVAQAKFEAQSKDNERVELEAKGLAEAARSKAQGEADGKLLIAEAEAKSITAVQDALAKVQNPQMVLSLRQLEIANTQAERWDGRYPQWYMGGGGGAVPQLLLNVPPPPAAASR
jgi:hypothetical protein